MGSNKQWKSSVLNVDATIAEAITVLNNSKVKLVLLTDTDNKLQGVISDGDIRRAMLNKLSVSDPARNIMSSNPIIGLKESIASYSELLFNNKIPYLPIVDKDGYLVDLVEEGIAREVKKASPVFLMAGGFGKRLHPLTENIPKPLLKVGEQPILETIMDSFIDYGFEKFFISIHYKSEMIRDYFSDRESKYADITFVEEHKPLGTGGALSLLETIDEPLILMNSDLLTKVNFTNLLTQHKKSGAAITICGREYTQSVPYGVIKFEQDAVSEIVEKPSYTHFVNAGIYCISPEIINNLPKGKHFDMPDLINQCLGLKQLVSIFPIHEYWLDIGQIKDFQQAQVDFVNLFR